MQAGITTPAKELDLRQGHDCFTQTELLTYEDQGGVSRLTSHRGPPEPTVERC